MNYSIPDISANKTFHSNSDIEEISESYIMDNSIRKGEVEVFVKVTDDNCEIKKIDTEFMVE